MVANFKDEIIQILYKMTFSCEASSLNPVESWSEEQDILSSQDGSNSLHQAQLQTFQVEKLLKWARGIFWGIGTILES